MDNMQPSMNLNPEPDIHPGRSKKILAMTIVVLVILVVAGIWAWNYWKKERDAKIIRENAIKFALPPPPEWTYGPAAKAATAAEQVTITDKGFSPSKLTVEAGTIVTFINKSTKSRWPASNPHPQHTDYSEFDARMQVAPGSSWSFTFDKPGTWKYHDHLHPELSGTIIVK
jgi:plastocyanin